MAKFFSRISGISKNSSGSGSGSTTLTKDSTLTSGFTNGFLLKKNNDATLGEIDPATLSTDITVGTSDIISGIDNAVLYTIPTTKKLGSTTDFLYTSTLKILQQESLSNSVVQQHQFRRARAATTLVVSGDITSQINALGHDGVTYQNTARIQTVVDGPASAGVIPQAIEFWTGATTGASIGAKAFINSAGKLGIGWGGAISLTGLLDIKAPGALSTDNIARIRNSANTVTLFEINGDGSFYFRGDDGTTKLFNNGSANLFLAGGSDYIGFGPGYNVIYSGSRAFQVETLGFRFYVSNGLSGDMSYYKGSLMIGNYVDPGSASHALLMANAGGVPAAEVDSYWQYGKDIVAGNSAPHFKTETGDIIRLYKQSLTDNTTGTPANQLVDVGVAPTQANINDNFASIYAILANNGLVG